MSLARRLSRSFAERKTGFASLVKTAAGRLASIGLICMISFSAAAQSTTVNFGPVADSNSTPVALSPLNVGVNPALASDIVLALTIQADFSGGGSFAVTIDGVPVGSINSANNCVVENFSFTIPQATLASQVTDGNLAITLTPSGFPDPANCLPLGGPFATLAGGSFSFAFQGSLTYTVPSNPPDPTPPNPPDRTTQIERTTKNFVNRRADQITGGDPDLSSRLSAISKPVHQPSFKDTGMKLGGTNGSIQFSTSLRDIAAAQLAKRESMSGAGRSHGSRMSLGQGLPGTVVSSHFDVWVEGKWIKTDNGTADSKLGMLYVGTDYRLNKSMIVGLLGQIDWADEADTTVTANLDGRGWMIGPYIAAQLHSNILFDGRIAWGQSNNDFSVGTSTGRFDTDRWLIKGQFTGDFRRGRWLVSPQVAAVYFAEDLKATTDNMGNAIGKQTVKLGRVTFGPEISTEIPAGIGGTISPFFAVKGIWDYQKDDTVSAASGFVINDNNFRGRVEAGATLQSSGGIAVSAEEFYDGLGADDLDVYGGSVRLTVPLR